jgi:hypothetical protein
LTPADWLGADLTRLDSWVRSTVKLMETYETSLLPTSTYYTSTPVTYTTYISGKGLVLDQNGGAIFDNCIPKLSYVRPNLFQIVSVTPGYTTQTFTQTYQQTLVWQTLLGPHLTSTFTNLGSQLAVPANVIGSGIGFAFYAVVAILCFPAGSAIAAITLPSVILLIVWFTGLLPLASLGFIMALAAFLLLFQIWLKGG